MPSPDVLALTGTTQFTRWNVAGPVGTSVVVTYSFSTAPASYDSARPGFSGFSAAQQSYARLALATWADVSGISFVEVPAAVGGQIRLGLYDMSGVLNSSGQQASGFAYYPQYTSSTIGGVTTYSPYFNGIGGDVFLNANFYAGNDASMAPGQRGYSILLHELGHAIGFKHPFEGTPTIDPSHDSGLYTVLSYNRSSSTTTLGTVDIEASQYYYGGQDLVTTWNPVTLTLTRTGTAASEWVLGTELTDILNGREGNDTLRGELGNDSLDGGAGIDSLFGGLGNDTYFVDTVFDVIVENASEGIDTVYTNSNYTVGVNVEQLYLQESAGAAAAVGNGGQNLLVGNSFDNVLDGGSNNDTLMGWGGNDTLEGGTGTDGMIGGTGNDTYFVDSVFDVIVENAGEGIDTVYTNSNYALGANVEQLYLMESAGAATGVGNGEQNLLVGNTFNNVLDGGSNNDTLRGGVGNDTLEGGAGTDGMIGGTGNDTYFVDTVFDVIVENANEGIDTVYTNSNYIIGANVEQLYLMESAGAATGVGNGEQNLLVGNSFANALDGGANNDTLRGGGGNDTLFGGTGTDGLYGEAGNDNFVFNPGTAAGDVIVDFAGNGAGAGDQLSFVGFGAGAAFTNQDATHWLLTYNAGASIETITFQNAAAIHANDFQFL